MHEKLSDEGGVGGPVGVHIHKDGLEKLQAKRGEKEKHEEKSERLIGD